MQYRQLKQIIPGLPTSDGAGVVLRRSLGQHSGMRLDPFLMLDAFSSDQPNDYIGGFPAHPHRGFETVTYMLDGHLLHEDHLGHRGHLKSGDVQWMTAGRGIIHSEMPQQERGLLRGFQLWINLPAKEKMKPASYQDIPTSHIPVVQTKEGVRIKVIAGSVPDPMHPFSQESVTPLISGPIQGLTTEAIYLDIHLPKGQSFEYALPLTHHAFAYPYEGELYIGKEHHGRLSAHQAGVLTEGETVMLSNLSTELDTRFLLIAGKPLNEPIVQRGPFVMNTKEEIEQALYDYQHGQLV
jgi:quercetin 2,3-dioxygenase